MDNLTHFRRTGHQEKVHDDPTQTKESLFEPNFLILKKIANIK